MKTLLIALLLAWMPTHAGVLENGTLLVDGKPFFPFGTWGGSPELCADLGLNTALHTVPKTPEGVEEFRARLRVFADHGTQVAVFLGYGGSKPVPWTRDEVVDATALQSEPNLLAWYLGDDVYETGLPGVQRTAEYLRELTPDIPTAADYIGDIDSPEAQDVYGDYVDIKNNYAYPIPGDDPANVPSLDEYAAFFDDNLAAFGEPRWTVIQCFQWNRHSDRYNLGVGDATGAIPEPEQVRLLAFTALSRGIRGLLLYPDRSLAAQPEHAGEWALIAREVDLVAPQLAAGRWEPDLTCSDPQVLASAFITDTAVVIPALLARPHYNRWVDAAIAEEFTIDCPWPGSEAPRAVVVAPPDVHECSVEPLGDGIVRVRVPSLEIAQFVVLTPSDEAVASLRAGARAAANSLAHLIVPAAAAQARESAAILRHSGRGGPRQAAALVAQCARSSVAGRHDEALRHWRAALRTSRTAIDGLMKSLDAERDLFPASQRAFLESPHALHNISGIARPLSLDRQWHFVTEWDVVGPFALGWDGTFVEGNTHQPTPAPGFDHPFPPQIDPTASGTFATVDGPAMWRSAETNVSGMLDLTGLFDTPDTVVSYARVIVTAPRDMEVEASLGSNDGAKVFVNGEEAFSRYCARTAFPHQDSFPVNLRAGRNVVLVKVANLAFGWQLYFSIRDQERVLEYSRE